MLSGQRIGSGSHRSRQHGATGAANAARRGSSTSPSSPPLRIGSRSLHRHRLAPLLLASDPPPAKSPKLRLIIQRMHRRRRRRQHLGKRSRRRSRRAQRRHRRSIHHRPRHRLEDRSRMPRSRNILRRNRRSVEPASSCSTTQTTRPAMSCSPAPARASCALPPPPSLASAEPSLRLLPLTPIRLLDRCLAHRRLTAPLRPPIPQPLHKSKADRRPLPRRVERKRRRQIQRHRHHQRQHNRGPGRFR